ncbi:MAG: 5'-nucleotidase C-terminal domain-containing protein [Bacteroidales bacterium]|nr:5'-nucleotidase C-terminal domain-containing protein [Bacteroidales bacterium]
MKVLKILYSLIFALVLISCNNSTPQESATWESSTVYIPVDSTIAKTTDAQIDSTIKPYKEKVDSAMNEVIGFSEVEHFKNKPNGLLNNLSADMVLEMSKKQAPATGMIPQICLLNYGGLRFPLPKGSITIGNVYQLMPFENEMVLLKLTGNQVDSLFRYVIESEGQPIAGCKILKKGKDYQAFINNKPFDKTKNYVLVTSDYLADGGDKMSFLKNPTDYYRTGVLIRDAMIDYIKELHRNNQTLKPNKEERIIL